jgi:hypothetical protein
MERMKYSIGRRLGDATCVTAALLLASCATAATSERTESSAASIRAAQEVGASNVPQAALHLQLAREQSERAGELIQAGGSDDREQAEWLLMRAQADAELALALAREDTDRSAAQQAVSDVHKMQAKK